MLCRESQMLDVAEKTFQLAQQFKYVDDKREYFIERKTSHEDLNQVRKTQLATIASH